VDKLKAIWRIMCCKGFAVLTVEPTRYRYLSKIKDYDVVKATIFLHDELETMKKENEHD
jgi:hypothetical protein